MQHLHSALRDLENSSPPDVCNMADLRSCVWSVFVETKCDETKGILADLTAIVEIRWHLQLSMSDGLIEMRMLGRDA